MGALAIEGNGVWHLPHWLRHAPAWSRCPQMRLFGQVQVLTGAVTLWALFFADAGWSWWALALFGCFLGGCIWPSVGLQRYFAHRSFEAPRWVVVMFPLLGVKACIGAAAGWSVSHRRHCMHADGAGDPHPGKGARFAGAGGRQL